MNISESIDNLVGIFSPKSALERKYFRARLGQVERKKRSETYAAAKTNRLTGNWSPVNTSINDVIRGSSADVRARVRQLVRDFPYFANAVNRIVDYSVGSGIIFQSKIKDAKGNLDKKLIGQVEDAFSFWMDEADVARKLHYYEIMQLTKRQDVESGEYIVIKRWRPKEGRYLPYVLQVYESDWLTTQYDTYFGDAMQVNRPGERYNIDQGVKYDRLTGEVISYMFTDPDSWGNSVEVPARDVIHGFQMLRPGQRRGISSFASGVLLANDLSDYMDAEVDAAKMAAKYLAFVTSDAPDGRQLSLTEETNGEGDIQKIDEMENAIIEYLRPNEKIEIATNPRPGSAVTPFTRLVVTMLSVTTGVPYELLSGDYQGMNYSTGKMSRNDFTYYLKPISDRHIRNFCQPTFRGFMDAAAFFGKVRLPNFQTDPYPFYRAEWQPPGMMSNDPLREGKAAIDLVASHLNSPQEYIRARGRDPEDVLREFQQWEQWKTDYNIKDPLEVSTAMQNNPAAVAKEPNGKK